MNMHVQRQKKIVTPAGKQPPTVNEKSRSQHPFDASLTDTNHIQSPGVSHDAEIDSSIVPQFGHHFSNIRIHAPMPETIQTKLAVNQPGDSYEQEAERVAEQIMEIESPGLSETPPGSQDAKLGANDLLTRKGASDTSVHEATSAPPLVDEVLSSGGGQPLDDSTRSFMEPRFGHDFSRVRIHTDERAVHQAQDFHAQAFTIGEDIYFGNDRFQPDMYQGQRMLAHELAHTIQQEQRSTQLIQRIPLDAPPASTKPLSATASSPAMAGTQRALIETALNSKEPADVKEVSDFTQATEAEKFQLINILLDQFWVGPSDEDALEAIWNSFGENVLAEGASHFDIWKKCVDRGAELDELQAVTEIKNKFASDVTTISLNYLHLNQEYIQKETERLGLQQSGGSPEQNQEMQKTQEAAQNVKTAQEKQAQLREVIVGYNSHADEDLGEDSIITTTWSPARFDPNNKPEMEQKPEGGWFTYVIGTDQPQVPWDKVNEQYQKLVAIIVNVANRYPALYALVGQENEGALKDVAQGSPEQARMAISQVMQGVSQKISEAIPKIGSEIKYQDLIPIHQQLYGGMEAPSGTPWNMPLYQWIAQQDIGEYKAQEFWRNLGLVTLAAAAFVVAELATAGGATFLAAASVGLGVGIGIGQAAESWEKYMNMSQAAQTNVTSETALITQGQVTGALVEAILNTVTAFIAAYGPFSKGMKAAGEAEQVLVEAEQLESKALTEAEKAAPAALEGAEEIKLSPSEYQAALGHVFPGQFLEPITQTVEGIGQHAAQRAVNNPAFVQACQIKNWTLAGTLFHSAAAEEARTLPAAVLPQGWILDAEFTIQSGLGGSRADILLRGPAGQIIEFDWKTTGRSALSSAARSEMERHAGQILTNLGGTLTTQESRSWVDFVRPLLPGVF